MSPAIIGLIAAAAALILIPIIVWVWINRAPKMEHEGPGVLPLFTGSGMMIASAVEEETDSEQSALADRARIARNEAERAARKAAAASGTATNGAPMNGPTPQAPRGAPARTASATPPATPARGQPMPAPTAPATAPPPRAAAPPPAAAPYIEPLPYSPPKPPPSIRTFETGRPSASADHGNGDGASAERQVIRFDLPTDGTLQFLPGRLEITSGQERGREIRFVRLPGPQGTEFTFGRSEGEKYRHVQLQDQTVSRQHARMRFHEGRWYLLSLSQTNPVIHAGRPLAVGEEQQLNDGDRIEMGEVQCTFKHR